MLKKVHRKVHVSSKKQLKNRWKPQCLRCKSTLIRIHNPEVKMFEDLEFSPPAMMKEQGIVFKPPDIILLSG